MPSDMSDQGGLAGEGPPTHTALVWLLAGVCTGVPDQGDLPGERAPAVVTLEGLGNRRRVAVGRAERRRIGDCVRCGIVERRARQRGTWQSRSSPEIR